MNDLKKGKNNPSQVEKVYRRLKQDLGDFELLPGDRFTETEVALRTATSRTPVREALIRLEREGYLQKKLRAGWMVKPFDFRRFEELYDLRTLLETNAVEKLTKNSPLPEAVRDLGQFWFLPPWERSKDGQKVFREDENFHHVLVREAGNKEITQLHWEITERIRMVRRLDFTREDRIEATYQQHGAILEALWGTRPGDALELLRSHITQSRAAVQNITFFNLELARSLRY